MRTMKHWALAAAAAAALALAGCGGGGSSTSGGPGTNVPVPNPAEERSAIQMALNAAGQALSVVTAAGENATDTQIMAAETAVAQAKAAIAAADDLSDAEIAQHNTALGLIETPLMMARNAYDESQRMMDVASARSAAMQSYMDADADATKAENAADAAEATAPGSVGAMAARDAATAARAAANAAKMAHDAIMDGDSKVDADAQAAEAATQAGNANSSYMMAKRENDTIQTAAIIGEQQQEERNLADARDDAGMYADEVESHYMAAKGKATDARAQATAARDAANKAMAARTDYANANKYAMMAEAEADKAEAARDRAMAAHMAAQAANTAAMNAETSTEARSQADIAKAQNVIATEAHTGDTGAGMAYMAAMAAAEKAGDAADVHVLQLFLAANGAHVMDVESTEADEKAAHVTSVGAAMAAIAAATDGNQAAGTTATAAWPGDTVDDPSTTTTDESSEGMLSLTVSPAGAGDLPFELGADRAADDTVTPAVTVRIQTAKKIDDLGRFQGYEVWEDDGDATTATDRGRVIVFTDKTQDKSPVTAAAAETARTATRVAITTPGELAKVTSTGTTITGVEWTPGGDTGALTGTLTCPSDASCGITLGDDGAVTAITGYVFTGSRAAKAAVEACAADCQATANNNYLVFGLWLDEDTTTDPNTNTFGAFFAGGASDAIAVAVTGTASYSGKAAGAHHKTGEGVNWFDGNASLTANFGNATAPGTISGAISDIRVAGGDPMSDSIYLRQTDLTPDDATFNGVAVMGGVTAPGAATYEFQGTWSGSFFGPTADDPATTGDGNDESITAPLGAAGTFGVTKSEGTGDDMVVESFVGAFGAHKQ